LRLWCLKEQPFQFRPRFAAIRARSSSASLEVCGPGLWRLPFVEDKVRKAKRAWNKGAGREPDSARTVFHAALCDARNFGRAAPDDALQAVRAERLRSACPGGRLRVRAKAPDTPSPATFLYLRIPTTKPGLRLSSSTSISFFSFAAGRRKKTISCGPDHRVARRHRPSRPQHGHIEGVPRLVPREGGGGGERRLAVTQAHDDHRARTPDESGAAGPAHRYGGGCFTCCATSRPGPPLVPYLPSPLKNPPKQFWRVKTGPLYEGTHHPEPRHPESFFADRDEAWSRGRGPYPRRLHLTSTTGRRRNYHQLHHRRQSFSRGRGLYAETGARRTRGRTGPATRALRREDVPEQTEEVANLCFCKTSATVAAEISSDQYDAVGEMSLRRRPASMFTPVARRENLEGRPYNMPRAGRSAATFPMRVRDDGFRDPQNPQRVSELFEHRFCSGSTAGHRLVWYRTSSSTQARRGWQFGIAP